MKKTAGRILVTGASGFLGDALCTALLERGEDVLGVGRNRLSRKHRNFAWAAADLRTETMLGWSSHLEGVATVYHLAWSSLPATSNADPVGDAHDNILGTLRLLEAARSRPGLRLVFASSGGTVYGRLNAPMADEGHQTAPNCAYGVSKLAIESYLQFYAAQADLRPVIVRLANPYGVGQMKTRNFGAVSTFLRMALAGETIRIYGDGSVVRDYIHIADAVSGLIAGAGSTGPHTVYNIGSGIGTSLRQIIDSIAAVTGNRPPVEYLPARSFDVPRSVLDIGRAQADLGWQPQTGLHAGLAQMIGALA